VVNHQKPVGQRIKTMNEEVTPQDHNEAIALFRAQVIGQLLCRQPENHGELADVLRELAQEPVRPPGQDVSRTYSAPTLQRWYYAYKQRGIEGLKPQRRSDGYALRLNDEQRKLVLDTRRDHPRVSAVLILRTLKVEGRLPEASISPSTLRRFYAANGLDRISLNAGAREARRRWEATAPNKVWHTDVCHGPALRIDGKSVPLRIHALLDDNSRYVVAIEARSDERESAMLALVVKALRLHGAPEVLYTDNGPTYIGKTLATVCARLGIGLVHAKPYDPQARGKMERFWRTLQEQCLNHCAGLDSLHDVQVRMVAWLQQHYHQTPHGGLMGKLPAEVYEPHPRKPVPDAMLREALIVRGRRRVRRDGTLSIAGIDFELEQGFLAGRSVTIARSLLDPNTLPWVEHEQQRLTLSPVDAQHNGRHPRKRTRPRSGIDAVAFDPASAMLKAAIRKSGGDQ
jgi:transposase InsO family protein